ncbi:hypothetical protein CUMW_227970 [Citrus unshiu]|uniref:Strictosidine synthase conserved region domain-containing protein n=1 Tax=Citrus unshiu TaxID=55188 RepID=A0A2H5QGH8_CITUN|nr:hypothetical protein CUMW_227970 [Citrus unshiu]
MMNIVYSLVLFLMIYSSLFDGIQLQLPGGLVLKALLSIVVVKGHMLVFLTKSEVARLQAWMDTVCYYYSLLASEEIMRWLNKSQVGTLMHTLGCRRSGLTGPAQLLASSAEGIPFRFTNALDIDPSTGVTEAGGYLKYDPHSNEVTIIYRGLAFPNGVALIKDKTFLLVAESMYELKIWLYPEDHLRTH